MEDSVKNKIFHTQDLCFAQTWDALRSSARMEDIMVVKLNNGAVREIKKAEPIVEKRFTFNGDTLRMVA